LEKRRSLDELLEAAKLFHALSDNKFINTKTLRALIGNKSEKTLERRFELIRKDFKSFDLVYKKNSGYQLIPCIANLQPKKLKEKKVLFEEAHQESLNKTIATMVKAMERRKWVTILNYKPVSPGEGGEYKVLPLQIYNGVAPYIIAVNSKSKTIRRFNLKRGDGYLMTSSVASEAEYNNYQSEFKKIQYDDFGWTVDRKNPLRTVLLKLNKYSMSMIDHDFPELAKKRKLSKRNNKQSGEDKQDEFEFTLEVNYCNIKAIGRLVTGMLNHIKVEGSKEVREQFRRFVEETVSSRIDKHISY